MEESEKAGNIRTEYKSCASLMIQCLSDAGIADRQSGFSQHINNAKNMGLMPDDIKVIRKTMADYGFIMQGSRLEGAKGIDHVFSMLRDIDVPTTIFVVIVSYYNTGGHMVAFRYDKKEYHLLSEDAESKQLLQSKIGHIWMRWDDCVNRSPCPRKNVNRQSTVKSRKPDQDTEYYRYFQPNPYGNDIGDCVIRGVAGAMNITWQEALERLSTVGNARVNSRNVYPQLLEREGFVPRKIMIKSGRRLGGKQFCNEMNKIYHNGERIFAHVGMSHVAAIVPDNDSKYKVFDSWDSSEKTVGEYWVKSL